MDFSIIITAHNAQDTIAKCVWGIMKIMREQFCTYPPEQQIAGRLPTKRSSTLRRAQFEILVIDNASTDKTRQAIENYSGIRYIHLKTKKPTSRVRNLGVSNTSGRTIVFIDGNSIFTDSWKGNFTEAAQQVTTDHSLVSYKLALPTSSTWVTKTWFGDTNYMGAWNYTTNGHMIIARATLCQFLGFDETLPTGEDQDFWSRLKADGGTSWATNLVATHHGYPDTVAKLFQYEREQGWSNYANLDTLKTNRTVSFLLVYVLLFCGLLVTEGVLGMGIWALSVFSLVSLIDVSFKVWARNDTFPTFKHFMKEYFLTGVYFAARLTAAMDVIWQKVTRK